MSLQESGLCEYLRWNRHRKEKRGDLLAGVRVGERRRQTEIWWGFTGTGAAPSSPLRMARARWVSEAGAGCSGIGTGAIWQLFPEEISLLSAPPGAQGTEVALKNTAYGGVFGFKLVKTNFKYNEVMLEIQLLSLKIMCIWQAAV